MARNTLRIIGGEWRSRKLAFPVNPQLRPTPDRIRETLFNWLQDDLYGARCLDLFAGSGALGLEALSRGAAECVFVESHRPTLNQLKHNLDILKTKKYQLVNTDALTYLSQSTSAFDIIFLDPPFDAKLYEPTFNLLLKHNTLTSKSKIYVESSNQQAAPSLPAQWQILRDKKSGDVRYQLIKPQ